MLFRFATLGLPRHISDEDHVVLVGRTAWLSMRVGVGYQEIDSRRALVSLEDLARRRFMEVRNFVSEARLGSFAMSRMDDGEVLRLLQDAIRDGRVIAVKKGAAKSGNDSATAELRRLVAQIGRETRGKLSFRGRHYKLVAGDDLSKTPGRDAYEVIGQAEAHEVLDGISRESPSSAGIIHKASEKIGKDWRPPFTHPEGLVLLRRTMAQATTTKDAAPAITPSQLAKLAVAEKSVSLEVVVLGLDDEPLKGISYVVETPDGETHEGDLGSGAKTTVTSAKKGGAGVSLKWSEDSASG